MSTQQTDSARQVEKITKLDIECARIDLDSACDAIAAVANAAEIIASLDSKPDKLFAHTIPRLMAHVHFLASSLDNNIGCFIEKVELSKFSSPPGGDERAE